MFNFLKTGFYLNVGAGWDSLNIFKELLKANSEYYKAKSMLVKNSLFPIEISDFSTSYTPTVFHYKN